MTITTTRRRVLAGVAVGAVTTAIGVTVSSPANAERPALSGLWQEWQRFAAEILRDDSQELAGDWWNAAADKLVAQFTLKCAGLNPYWSQERVDELEEKLQDKLCDARWAIEDQIVRTPARTTEDVLIKLRVARYWIETDNTVDGVLREDVLTGTERLALSAYTDLERLSDGRAS